MIRQVDWAWVAMGAVEVHHERPRPEALRTDRVDRIKPVAAASTVRADRARVRRLVAERVLTGGA